MLERRVTSLPQFFAIPQYCGRGNMTGPVLEEFSLEALKKAARTRGARGVTAQNLKRMLHDGGEIAVLDVREEGMFAKRHMLLACTAPLSQLELRAPLLVPRRNARVVVLDGGDGLAQRAAELAAKLSVASLTRAWQILLKGLFEVRDATRPISACEMVLIRLAHAAELPPTDKLVKDLMESGSIPAPRGGGGAPAPSSSSRVPVASGAAMLARAPMPAPSLNGAAAIRTLEDIVALCEPRSELRVNLEHNVHLVHLEPGRIEIRPNSRAPRTLANDLQQKLRGVTGERWTVSIASQGGAPTLSEQKQAVKSARFEAVAQEPMVRAVLDRFPGAEIVAVRDTIAPDVAAPMPESDSES